MKFLHFLVIIFFIAIQISFCWAQQTQQDSTAPDPKWPSDLQQQWYSLMAKQYRERLNLMALLDATIMRRKRLSIMGSQFQQQG